MMSGDTRLSMMIVNAQAEVVALALRSGTVEFMSGDRPEQVEGAARPEQVLGVCRLAETAFAKAVNGVLVANKVEKSVALRTGDPTWVRLRANDGAIVSDGTVGLANANCITKVTTIVKGQILDVTGFRYAVAKKF